ncbi:hypothetical protein D5S18_07230 [Nocardia panacis]|uniref:Uncharacterized protein n=2 Tax=Nocardia panacis TaxID=2340916 RepID=A0A3A4KF29_9NOCA|nr:hypothetical protein D5S18_07230 [Nocardia panacis]
MRQTISAGVFALAFALTALAPVAAADTGSGGAGSSQYGTPGTGSTSGSSSLVRSIICLLKTMQRQVEPDSCGPWG